MFVDHLVFPQMDGTLNRRRSVRRIFQRLKKRAGIHGKLTMHELRHTHLSQLLDEGASPSDVKDRAGQKLLSTLLDVYTHTVAGRGRLGELTDRMIAQPRKAQDKARSSDFSADAGAGD
jgi:integrase